MWCLDIVRKLELYIKQQKPDTEARGVFAFEVLPVD